MRKLIHEPLFHFLLLGAGIFILYLLVQKNTSGDHQIIINDNDVAHISSLYESQWHHPPTSDELTGLISEKIRQEVFYREALKMNLDQNDEIVKQRLAEKMEFLSNDLSKLVEPPTDEKLKTYFEKNKDKYLTPYSLNFYQIILTPERHTDTRESAAELLRQFSNAKPEELKNQGDPSYLSFYFSNESAAKLKVDFAGEMAESIRTLPLNKWAGPIKSAYGWHLVYITKKVAPHLPSFSEVKKDLKRDYQNDQEQESRTEVYLDLKKNYEIEITADTLTTDQYKEINEKLNEPI